MNFLRCSCMLLGRMDEGSATINSARRGDGPTATNAQHPDSNLTPDDRQPQTEVVGNLFSAIPCAGAPQGIMAEEYGNGGEGSEGDTRQSAISNESGGSRLDQDTSPLPPLPQVIPNLQETPLMDIPTPFPPLEHAIMVGSSSCPSCVLCNHPGTAVCSGCRSSRYCSVECRRQDWPTHKLLCDSFRDFLVPPLPSDKNISLKRAIFFPADATIPQFVWVKCERRSSGYDHFDEGSLLGHDHPLPGIELVQKNLVREKQLDNSIDIIFSDTFGIDGSHRNKSVLKATQSKTQYPWAGNVVAVRHEGIQLDPRLAGDMTMEDFRHAVDFFVAYDGTRGKRAKVSPTAQKYLLTPSSPDGKTVLVNYGKRKADGSFGSPWVVQPTSSR